MNKLKISHGDFIYTIEDLVITGGKPAKLNALPEDCHPAEPLELEYRVTAITLDPGAVSYGGDIESLINDWAVMDELVIAKYEEEYAP